MTALPFGSPVLVASGCGGTGRELAAFDGLAGVGAFVTRTLTLAARAGAPAPRVSATASGVLHATGLPNPGPEQFLALELPWLASSGVAPVVSLAAADAAEFAELARLVAGAPGVRGLELNLLSDGGMLTDTAPQHLHRVASAACARAPAGVPVFAKIGHTTPDPVTAARALLDAGVSGLVLGGGVPAAFADGRHACLVGPAIRSVALRVVAEVCSALPGVAVIGSGGIRSAADARAFAAVGAAAVQIGSALLDDPTCAARLAAALQQDPTTARGEQ